MYGIYSFFEGSNFLIFSVIWNMGYRICFLLILSIIIICVYFLVWLFSSNPALNLPRKEMDTAGLKCPPLMWAVHKTNVAMAKPAVKAFLSSLTSRPGNTDVAPWWAKMNSAVPTNSAAMALQKSGLTNSCFIFLSTEVSILLQDQCENSSLRYLIIYVIAWTLSYQSINQSISQSENNS